MPYACKIVFKTLIRLAALLRLDSMTIDALHQYHLPCLGACVGKFCMYNEVDHLDQTWKNSFVKIT
jgi:hypothetical protein